MRRSRLAVGLITVATAGALAIGAAGTAQAGTSSQRTGTQLAAAAAAAPVNTPVTGTFTDAVNGAGTFAGTFTPSQVTRHGNNLSVVGTLAGTLTDSTGATLGTVNQLVTAPLQVAGTCQVLNLDLGPLDLNLLGLKVHLNEVVLDITAQQGPGNLLGNLLCAVAGLLDGNGNGGLNAVVGLLNQILGILGQL
jgi:hypothetical protein